MTRRVLLLATALCGIALLPGLHAAANETHASEAVRELEFIVERPGGERIDAHFLVASSGEQAVEAAARAARALYPGSTLQAADEPLPAGGVSAQWNPWGWRWDRAELPVVVTYNPAGNPGDFTASDVAAVLESWSTVPGSNFAFAYGGLTETPASMSSTGPDGQNVIAWADLGCDPGCVLGVTTKSFESHEADIVLNRNPRARLGDGTGDSFDVYSVLLHEAGHLAGLEHSCPVFGPCTDEERAAVMFFSYDGIQRELADDDVAGLTLLYPAPAGVVAAAPREGIPVAGAIPAPSSLTIDLSAGWNLVVLPAGSIEAIMTQLTCVEAVYGLGPGGWAAWVRGLASPLQTLTATQPGQPYWVSATGSCAASFQ